MELESRQNVFICRLFVNSFKNQNGHWAGYALILLLPFSVYWPIGSSFAPEVLDFYARPGFYLSDLAVGAVLLANLVGKRGHYRWGQLKLTWPLLALIGLAILTMPMALSPGLAGYMALRWFIAVSLYLSLIQSDLPLKRLVTLFLVGLSLHALIGLGQVLKQGPLGLPGELAVELDRSGAAVITTGGMPWLRAYGLTFHPNVLGGFMVIGLLLSLPLLTQRSLRLLWWLLSVGLLLSFSRSAWLAAALVLPPVIGWLAWRQPSLRRPMGVILGGTMLLALVGTIFLTGQLKSRFNPRATLTESRSLSERGVLIGIALDVIANRPLTGIGAGNFPLVVQISGASVTPQPVHNVPLLLAAEIGLAAGGLWFWLWLTPGIAIDHLWRRPDPWPVVLIGAWLAWGVIGLWDSYPWALESGRLLTVTLFGLISRALENV